MADTAQDRTLPATPRKIQKAREEGQLARSRDLAHFAGLGVGVALLGLFAPELTTWLAHLVGEGLRLDARLTRDPQAMTERLGLLGGWMLVAVLAAGFGAVLLALAANVLGGGWNFTLAPLAPRLSKLDPLAGFKRLFAWSHLTNTLKSCLLALVLGGVGAWYLAGQWPAAVRLLAMPLPQAIAAGGGVVRSGLLLIALVLAAFALVDVPLQRHLLRQRLRMSVEEVKKEMRDVEGNTQVKAKMRLRMREMANRRMLAAVPRADLVVMNPTHYAVALAYDEARMAAPRVVAKGADLLALKIREVAVEAKVPVVQAPPLARALYAHTEIDQEVPARLFTAVAQVLAWVFQLRDALAAGRAFTASAPLPDVPADMDPLAAA
ncbi:MAG: EscU/YscU/HrcU family type III secretion system export apparatus switch protein [Burkholderiales bacterium]|nr:EscU/YscU/HrcU family type III secretion system export apparatus switch protein [Burkholderiales bacterium]